MTNEIPTIKCTCCHKRKPTFEFAINEHGNFSTICLDCMRKKSVTRYILSKSTYKRCLVCEEFFWFQDSKHYWQCPTCRSITNKLDDREVGVSLCRAKRL